ncbi:GLPGLI family protein [Bergeyella porcorum]|uniref:GLPGLI family protein n=1 Tax=Bergeyella porcorum TaxID=1735111 RepID=UPI0035EBE67E
MRKLLLLLGVLACFFNAYAQTYRYIYECVIKENGKPQSYYLVLDVNDKETKFYDYKFLEMDSLNTKNKHNNHKFRTNSVTEQVLKRQRNTHENEQYFTNNAGDYFVMKSKDNIKWTLHSDKKERDGYRLQKATTKFGGRHWEAWFSPDTGINEGPYKFSGLPGLVFEVKDTAGDFEYKLVKNHNLPTLYDTTDFLESYYGTTPIPVDYKQMVKIKLNDFNDPMANLIKVFKDGGKINMNGEDITSLEQLNQKRKWVQEDILKHYTPIELDKAIPYKIK